jgi:XTP/dITP diphosphohydrolase
MAISPGSRLVIATHNPGKLWEMRALLAPHGIEAISAAELDLPEPEETGASFASNAEMKAQSAAHASALPAIADDSGLCADALDGAPGLLSARWAEITPGGLRDFAHAIAKVEAALRAARAQPPFYAHFVSVIALAWPDGRAESFEGKVFGTLVFPPRGKLGFGYDPIFLPDGLTRTFGEMMMAEKQDIPADGAPALSHRARAFQAFARACLS